MASFIVDPRVDATVQPPFVLEAIHAAAALAAERGQALYAVGGLVRDIFLARPVAEADLSLEGDAVALAREVATRLGVASRSHAAFGTAIVEGPGGRLDIVTARRESYARPGALPEVEPATIDDDLARRDFTINAMALGLSPAARSGLLDPFDGQADLGAGLVRALHEQSFRDDPTRAFRAARYAARLGFRIEERTRGWMARDLHYLDLVSRERVRHEIDLAFREERWRDVLEAYDQMGLLQAADPALSFDRSHTGPPSWKILLPPGELEAREAALRLQLPRALKRELFGTRRPARRSAKRT